MIKERLLGADHADVAMTLHNIGALAADTGDIARAVEHLGRALVILDDALGPEHPRTLRCREVLASLRSAPSGDVVTP